MNIIQLIDINPLLLKMILLKNFLINFLSAAVSTWTSGVHSRGQKTKFLEATSIPRVET